MQLASKLKMYALILLCSVPFALSVWQIFSPPTYIVSFAKFTSLAPIEYVVGATSGYGIGEIRQFIDTYSTTPHTDIGIAENTGNPESAMEMYYKNNPTITVLYMDRQILGSVLDQYECLDIGHPLYFVSREEQQAGLNKFLVKIKTIKNPYGENTWGIYTLKSNCSGPTAHLQITKQ